MFIEFAIGTFLGIGVGMLTGITPGLHVNLVTTLALSFGLSLLSPQAAAAFIIALMVSHNIFDFIPSVFLGAPDEADALAVLPGHQLLLAGRGLEAVLYSSLGMLAALGFMIMLLVPLLFILPLLYGAVQPFLAFALLGVIIVMIFREKGAYHKLVATLIVLLAGCLGVATFSFNLNDPLLPLLSGLFGISVLVGNFSADAKIHPQLLDLPHIPIKPLLAPTLLGTIIGCMLNLFPGVGPSQASMISLSALKLKRPEMIIATTSAVSNGSLFGSLIALYAINKARNAPLAQLSELLTVTPILLIALFIIGVIATLLCSVGVLIIAPLVLRFIAKVKYGIITGAILLLIVALVIIRTGIIGVLILAIGTSLGLVAHHAGVGKHHLMACLLLPTIGYLLI